MPKFDDHPTVWPLEPHTRAKHEIMRRYLGGWFPVLGSVNGRVVFLDGFAGPGRYEGNEPGSPVIALETLLNHRQRPANCEFVFLFCEPEPARFASLQTTIDDLQQQHQPWPAKVRIEAVDQSFDEAVDEMLGSLAEQKKSLAPTFAFVDPFGVKGIEMDQIADLMSFERCELLLNLATQSMSRFISTPEFEQHHDALFGTPRWREAQPLSVPERRKFLVDLYKEQLRTKCGFQHTLQFEMVNPQGQHSYYLVYATKHRKGVEVMKDAMWAVDPTGGFRFSARLAGQEVMFTGDNLDTGPLQKALKESFGGRSVTIEAVAEYTLLETPFKLGHLKVRTLQPMEQRGEIARVIRTDGRPRRRNTYPDGSVITFA